MLLLGLLRLSQIDFFLFKQTFEALIRIDDI